MALAVGKYELAEADKDNFDKYMAAVGVGLVVRKLAKNVTSAKNEITLEGDKYTVKSTSTFKNHQFSFKLGEEFDEETLDGRQSKSVVSGVGDNKWEHVQKIKNSDTVLTQYREFEEGQMTLILEAPAGVKCVRVYKRI